MNKAELLEQHVGRLNTDMGAFFPGERVVFRGHDLHDDLFDFDWLELYMFGITGRRFTKKQMKVLHAMWTYTSYPDARLWNNRVAALAGTARSTGSLGIAAAIAISDAQLYGRGVDRVAIEFFIRLKAEVDEGGNLVDLVNRELRQKRKLAGYGRPIVSADERIAPLMKLVREQEMGDGIYLNLALEVGKVLLEGRWRLHINYGALVAALAIDIGLSPDEAYFYGLPAFLAGMPPCYLDAANKGEGLLFPVPCRMVLYDGCLLYTSPSPRD